MSGRHRASSCRVYAWLTALALTLSGIATVERVMPLSNKFALILAVLSPYAAVVAAGMCLAVSLMFRRVVMSLAAVVIVATTAAIQVPWYFFGQSPLVGEHVDVRVLSSNLCKGRTDAASFVQLAEGNADVLTVSELTAEAVQRFSAAGIGKVFPYSILAPAPNAGGIGLWSRFPLAALPLANHWETGMVAARLQIPSLPLDLVVASVHITSAVSISGERSFADWRHGITALRAQLGSFVEAAGVGSVIVAGDFNSTPDMRQFRDLLTDGYRDAVEQTGTGFAPTFPSRRWMPPFITIDHVVTRHAAASSIRTVDVRGSDHRALLATVEVPLSRAAS